MPRAAMSHAAAPDGVMPRVATPRDEAPSRSDPGLRAARRWLGLALGVLVAAGICALAVVVGRMPPFDRFVTDPLFFRRCLAAHVNFALVVWFYAFVSALLAQLPAVRAHGRLTLHAAHLAWAGVALMLVGAVAPGASAVLSNYVPTIDHPLFQAGQIAFALGVLASALDPRVFARGEAGVASARLPEAAAIGLRFAAFGLALAATSFALALRGMPPGLEPEAHYELLFWGAGHVLQLVSAIAMVVVWLMLLTPLLGRSPVSPGAARALFAAMLGPWLLSPALTLGGSFTPAYRAGHTWLMQWSIAPVVSIFLVLCALAVRSAWREGRIGARSLLDPRLGGFAVSAGLTLLGFGLGAAIRGSNTMVPAHYHASVGGVTVAFMAVAPGLLRALGVFDTDRRLRRLVAVQPLLYGAGMALFAAGFALAGAHGMGRKVYGAEQAARGLAESIGLTVMGVGGFVAAAGGLLFLGVVAVAWRRSASRGERAGASLAAAMEVAR